MRRLGSTVGLALIVGCGSSPAGPGVEAPFDFELTDPAGDTTAATTNPAQAPGIDLLRISGTLSPKELSLTLEFGAEITRWSDGAPNGLDGFVYFDVDESTSTGFLDQARDLGVDFYLDLRDNGFGRLAVVEQVKRRFVLVPATFDGTRLAVKIPRSALTLPVDLAPDLRLAIDVSGRSRAPVVDRAPNSGSFPIRPPPTP